MAVEEESLPHEQESFDDASIADPDQETSIGNTLRPSARKAPAWVDPDDTNIQVSLTSHTRLRKLRDTPAEDTVGGREYERRLRRQYEQINPTPEWASKARKKLLPKRRRSTSGSEDEDEVEDVVPDLLASTSGISGGRKPKTLTPGVISVDRLRDANQAAPAEGEIKSLQFHPSPQIPVLLTASTDRRLRLFHVCFVPYLEPTFFHPTFSPLGRWLDQPARPDAPYTVPPTDKRHVPPQRFLHPAHRSSPLLLYLRPPIGRLPPFTARFVGNHVRRQPRREHGYLRFQSHRGRPRRRRPSRTHPPRRLAIRRSPGRRRTQSQRWDPLSMVVPRGTRTE